jgi:porin
MKRSGAVLLAASLLAAPTVVRAQDRKPVELGATYITDMLTNMHGGIRRGTVWLCRGDVTASIDGSLIGIDGAELFVDVLAVQRPDFSGRFVGDAQTVSNVQANSAIRPYEAWIGMPVTPTLFAKAGLIDLNTEFDIQAVGKIFLNSSFGIGPDFSQSGVNGPSIFPAPATAAMVRYKAGGWTGRVGVFDAVAGSASDPRRSVLRLPGIRGALLVAEVERKMGGVEVQLGAWHYTTRFDPLDPGTARGVSQGAYALVEGEIAKHGTGSLHGWMRIGAASDRVNPIGRYLGGGMLWRDGPSQIGLAVAHARLGDPARRTLFAPGTADSAETAIELTYARKVLPGVSVQPDVQYVIHPGWAPDLDGALVAGVRFSFAIPAS